ncbi:MAG TPA: hypothetical protein VIO58_08850 [Candidatus Methanoperedens sp.]
MAKYNSNILLIFIAVLAVITSGCTNGQDVTSAFKALPEVQQFLKEHPDARITVTYWSKEEVAKSIQEISGQCDKSITPADMYKATINEGDLVVVSWINAETQTVVCSATQGSGGSLTKTPSPEQTSYLETTPIVTITTNSQIRETGTASQTVTPIPQETSTMLIAPVASIAAANNPNTPAADLIIEHKGGDSLQGGEWKLSIVPYGDQPAFVTSSAGSDFSLGNRIIAASTTNQAAGLTNSALTGIISLSPGAKYDVRFVHIPSGAVMVDSIVEVSGTNTASPKETPSVTPPIAGILAMNNPDTPVADLKIEHSGGDSLKGGEWKLSIVPLGNPLAFITSSTDSDFSSGNKIIATTTTEGATSLNNSVLTGVKNLKSGTKFDIKLVHIPSNAMPVDMVVEVR